MNSLSRTLTRAIPVLLVGALVLAASADAHPRHRGHRKHVYRAPRPVWVERAPVCAVPRRVVHQPARVVYGGTPFTYYADLGVYLSGVSLGIHFGNVAPVGYVYVDPWCGMEFASVPAYRGHCRSHGHPAYVTVRGPSCRYEDWRY